MPNTRLKEITDRILKSVMNCEVSIQHFEAHPLPDKDSIFRILRDIYIVLFPGYVGHSDLSCDTLEMRVHFSLGRIYEFLQIQLARELMHLCKSKTSPCGNCEKAAKEIVLQFLEEIPNLRKLLETDVASAFKNDPAARSKDEIIFSYPGLEAIVIHRVAHFFYKRGFSIIPRIMSEYAHSRTGIDIHPGATVGQGFFIDHGTGVVIGETTVIGDNVAIYQGVTLGALNFPKDVNGHLIRDAKRHPTIGNDVVIYAGATILGGNTVIGNNSVIGGNVWLTESVPEGSKVLMGDTSLKVIKRHLK